jgi:DNA-binding transcriptional regulator YbjK
MCLKKSYLILLLLLLSLQPLFSDVLLTDSEYQEITQALTDSEIALQNQAKSITELQEQLAQLEKLQAISREIIEQQSENLKQHENYLKEQRREQITTRILDHLRGFVGGYFVNEYQGNK